MSQAKRTPNTQQAKGKASSKQGSASSQRGRASAAKATAQARSGSARPSRSARAEQPEPSRAAYGRDGVFDDGTRNDITGVIIAVLGVALLIAVLTPTSGVLTQAVSGALHAVFGKGAFIVPAALLVWSVTFFVHVPQLVPGRVAVGLLLIAVAVMGLLGICTPGAEADSSRLFNEYVLADRGGYVGNGFAWLLLTLAGKVVGIVVLVGLFASGLIVIGLNVGQAVQSLGARIQQGRASARLRSEERAASHLREQNRPWGGAGVPVNVPPDYAPTALFDPNRPLSGAYGAPQYGQAGYAQPAYGVPPMPVPTTELPSNMRAQTTCIPFDQQMGYDPSASVVRPASVPAYANPQPAPAYFGCGEYPMGLDPATRGDEPVGRDGAVEPMVDARCVETELLAHGDSAFAAGCPVQADEPQENAVAQPAPQPEAALLDDVKDAPARAKSVRQWWDPADDWKREDFDPRDHRFRPSSAFVPGVLPGAPVEVESPEPEAEFSEWPATPAADRVEPCDSAASRVTARTKAAFEAQSKADAARRPAAGARGAVASSNQDVELPWEPARVAAPAVRAASTSASVSTGPFVLPDPAIMTRNEQGIEKTPEQRREAANMATRLQSTLAEFGVKAEVVDWVDGPTCTTYRVNPGEGVRVNRFTSLEDDIARALARDSVRIYAPVPGTSYVGIEVPNVSRQMVYFGDVLPYVTGGPLDFAVGLDAGGKPVHVDLAKLPHILIAGTTGSGKSVMVNAIIMSFLMRDTPQEVRLIMIDPKQVEFKDYDGIPHLIMPVITDMRQAAAALQWGVTEMDRRYRLFSNIGVRDLKGYSKLVADGAFASAEFPLQDLPSIVIVIDELADLMMVAKKDVEASIVRIAQLGRACGIHLVMATQSPRADVVTGLIRANVANRIGLKVAKGTDSKIVIDQTGAEKLLGNGDMLFLQTAWGDKPRRIQGCWLADSEIAQVVEHLKNQPAPEYNNQMAPLPGTQLVADFSDDVAGVGSSKSVANDDDPVAWRAAQLVVEHQLGSTSMIQRQLKLGYARAGRIMDMLEEMGVVGPANGSKPRDVLIRDLEELATLRGGFDGSEEDY